MDTPDNHPNDGSGVVTGTVTMLAHSGTKCSAEDIEKNREGSWVETKA